ncbi:MAG: hypothetical protein V4494_06270 [Chlamydiota bacterium]
MKNLFLSIILSLLALASLDLHVHHLSSGFCTEKVTSFMSLRSEWDLPAIENKQKVKDILSQDFFYLNKGAQAYVFLSHDHNYVLKIFKQHKLRPTNILSTLFHPQKEKYERKKNRFCTALNGCKEAFLKFQKETGLIYLHLNKEPDLHTQVCCFDEQGRKHLIMLDNTVFVLQRKADLIYPTIASYMENGEELLAKELISSIFDFLHILRARGVYDNDPILRKNFGVIENNKIIQIDIGTFHVDETKVIEDNSAYIVAPLGRWLSENYPELSAHFNSLNLEG